MKTFKEAALKLRQMDVKPAAKHMASQHIEKGNFKKTLDLLKFLGKKVNVDKSTEGSSKALWTIEATMKNSTTINELTTVDREKLVKMFDKLKKGSTVKIKSNDSIKKGDDYIEFVVKSKSTVRRGEVEKITLANKGNPTGVKRFLYKRVGTSMVSFAVGDMAASIVDIKESVNEDDDPCWDSHKQIGMKKKGGKMVPNCVPKSEEILTKAARRDKDAKKAVKTLKDIRKGKYKGVKMANEGQKPVSQMTPAEKAADAKRRKEYNAYQKSKRNEVTMQKLRNAPKGAPVMKKAGKDAKMLRFVLNRDVKLRKESIELDEAIDFRKAHQEIMAYAKKSGGIDKTDFEKVAYYVKAIGDNQNTPNVANKAFMAMKKFVGDMDTDPRDGVMLMLKKHGMMKNGRLVQESITEGALGKQWVNGAKRVKSGSITLVKAKFAYDLHTVMKNGKKVGTFVFDDGPDAFSVTNMSTKKVSWADQIDDIPKMFESKAPALKSSDYAKGTYQSAQSFKDKFAKKKKEKKESVDEAALEEKTKWKMGDGRPRNGPRIENERFWNLPYDSLKYIAKDAGEAMKANPTARKATTGPGNWADQVADAATVMQWRKKNGIKESKKFSDLR